MKALLFTLCLPALLLGYQLFFHQDGSRQVCLDAHQSPCPDVLRAEVFTVTHYDLDSLRAACALPEINACAMRTASWGEAKCVIHQLDSTPAEVFEHEMNHCRGWDHVGPGFDAYKQPWRLNRALWLAKGVGQLEGD